MKERSKVKLGVLLVAGYLVLLMKMFWLMRLNCDWWRLEQV